MLIHLIDTPIGNPEFYARHIPELMGSLLSERCAHLGVQRTKLATEFEKRFGRSIADVVQEFPEVLLITRNRLGRIYQLDRNLRDKRGNRYIDMFDFIDAGSLTARGTGAYRYIKTIIEGSIKEICDAYSYGKMGGEDRTWQ